MSTNPFDLRLQMSLMNFMTQKLLSFLQAMQRSSNLEVLSTQQQARCGSSQGITQPHSNLEIQKNVQLCERIVHTYERRVLVLRCSFKLTSQSAWGLQKRASIDCPYSCYPLLLKLSNRRWNHYPTQQRVSLITEKNHQQIYASELVGN